ncbi:MAG: HlyD family efflux transporter periplasmic adaptor subunit [Alphaproteobacteria bacterium]|nr:HlyD family efflux transporter periplasmic adaptor subunit [Alphaproteobacteria bacterium]
MASPVQAFFLSVLAALGLASPPASTYQGYVEGEYVLVAPQIAGTLETLNTSRGMSVQKGDGLYLLEHAAEAAALAEARAKADRSEATLDDLLKAKRPPELEALMAQRDQAEAALKIATITYERDVKQLPSKAVSQATVDADKAAMDQARGRLDEATAALATGRLSIGRDDAIRAAQADVTAGKAALAQAEWRLDQKRLAAPADAFVFDTLYRVGEFVPAGQPVVSLLPPENIKVRFFVPETRVSSIPAGTAVQVHINGDKETRSARVTYVSPKAEYSPPQLYNRDNRERLLFMIEATPDDAPQAFHPGQPVDVIVENP